MTTRLVLALPACLAMMVLGCSPAKPASGHAPQATATVDQTTSATPAKGLAQAALPPKVDPFVAETFSNCMLVPVSAAGATVWSYECPASRTSARLVGDEALPGFSIQTKSADNKVLTRPAILFFSKEKDAPITSIADAVRRASPDQPNAGCVLAPLDANSAAVLAPIGRKRFTWEPTGKVKLDWEDANSPSDDPRPGPFPNPPCGIYGPQVEGLITFEQLDGDPTRVAMISWGSELQIYLQETLKAAPR